MGVYIEPFDFKTLFAEYFLGSMELFIFGFIIIFSYVSAGFRFSNRLYLSILAISLIMLSIVLSLNGIYLLVVTIIGFVVFKAFTKLVT